MAKVNVTFRYNETFEVSLEDYLREKKALIRVYGEDFDWSDEQIIKQIAYTAMDKAVAEWKIPNISAFIEESECIKSVKV